MTENKIVIVKRASRHGGGWAFDLQVDGVVLATVSAVVGCLNRPTGRWSYSLAYRNNGWHTFKSAQDAYNAAAKILRSDKKIE